MFDASRPDPCCPHRVSDGIESTRRTLDQSAATAARAAVLWDNSARTDERSRVLRDALSPTRLQPKVKPTRDRTPGYARRIRR